MLNLASIRATLRSETRAGSLTRRRALLGLVGVASAALLAHSHVTRSAGRNLDSGSREDWRAFQSGYVAPDGRVIDTGNGGVTHSEGQGYGLIFAEHFDDRATFDNLLAWTQLRLGRTGDSLHAWRYQPDASVAVADPNNATDGDLLIAWALLRAGKRWKNPSYTDLGRTMAADLLAKCVRRVGDATVLLPAAFGFEHPDRVVINPSYYIFPALQALSEAAPDPAWTEVQADGLRILRQARFGRWQLPADWLEIANGSLATLAPAQGWPTRFSWDAIRVPLNLAWGGLMGEPALAAAAAFWTVPADGRLPAWTDLTNDSLAPYPANHGVTAIAALIRAVRAGGTVPDMPHVADAADYYSAALVLLCRVIWQESRASIAEI